MSLKKWRSHSLVESPAHQTQAGAKLIVFPLLTFGSRLNFGLEQAVILMGRVSFADLPVSGSFRLSLPDLLYECTVFDFLGLKSFFRCSLGFARLFGKFTRHFDGGHFGSGPPSCSPARLLGSLGKLSLDKLAIGDLGLNLRHQFG